MTKKKIFSGVQPSAIPTIGNYIGAMKKTSLPYKTNMTAHTVS